MYEASDDNKKSAVRATSAGCPQRRATEDSGVAFGVVSQWFSERRFNPTRSKCVHADAIDRPRGSKRLG